MMHPEPSRGQANQAEWNRDLTFNCIVGENSLVSYPTRFRATADELKSEPFRRTGQKTDRLWQRRRDHGLPAPTKISWVDTLFFIGMSFRSGSTILTAPSDRAGSWLSGGACIRDEEILAGNIEPHGLTEMMPARSLLVGGDNLPAERTVRSAPVVVTRDDRSHRLPVRMGVFVGGAAENHDALQVSVDLSLHARSLCSIESSISR